MLPAAPLYFALHRYLLLWFARPCLEHAVAQTSASYDSLPSSPSKAAAVPSETDGKDHSVLATSEARKLLPLLPMLIKQADAALKVQKQPKVPLLRTQD